MNHFFWISALLPLSLLASEVSIWGEYVTMRRTLGHQKALVFNKSRCSFDTCGNPDYDEACNVGNLVGKFRLEPGLRLGIGQDDRRHSWELTYLWLAEWHAQCGAISESDDLYFSQRHPDFLQDYAHATHAHVSYHTHMQNAEFNYFWHATPPRETYFCGSWFLGTRYTYVGERFGAQFTRRIYSDDHSSSYLQTSHDHIETHNSIAGIQIGGDLQINPMKNLVWDFRATVGMGFDYAEQRMNLKDQNDTVEIQHYSKWRISTPFIAGGSLKVGYQIKRWVNLYLGYEVLYFNGIAMATDQIVRHDTKHHHIRTTGEILFYGFFTGLRFSF